VDHVALVDLIPSGFEIVMTPAPVEAIEEVEEVEESESEEDLSSRLQVLPTAYAQSAASNAMWLQGQDRREDRMVLYATATEKMSEFVYRVKAVSRGSFVVPPPFAESMYDRQKRYRGVPTRIKIVKPD
jgi:uncharacterized protein YfaS (alpha-2-macroglobulin family)